MGELSFKVDQHALDPEAVRSLINELSSLPNISQLFDHRKDLEIVVTDRAQPLLRETGTI
jgi:hypothetical protein